MLPAAPSPTPSPSTLQEQTQQAVTSVSKLIVHGYHIGLILLIALVLRFLAFRAIGRFTRSIANGRLNRGLSRLELLATDGETIERRSQRAATLGSVLRSITNAVIATVALILIMGELGLNLAPILASAGIVGVAVGFGAQSVVKDFLSGLFLVLEDQYGVGDVVDLQQDMGLTGTVEAVGLRSTRVRDVRGNLWHIRNGNINQVGNITQGWSRPLIDVLFDLSVDVPLAKATMLSTALAFAQEEDYADDILEEPAVWGVEDVTTVGITIRLAIKTHSAAKDTVARALRERLLAAFDDAGLALAGGVPVQITTQANLRTGTPARSPSPSPRAAIPGTPATPAPAPAKRPAPAKQPDRAKPTAKATTRQPPKEPTTTGRRTRSRSSS